MHGSPYHVYPTNNYPAIQAFQGSSNTAVYNVTASPLMASNLQHIVSVPGMFYWHTFNVILVYELVFHLYFLFSN